MRTTLTWARALLFLAVTWPMFLTACAGGPSRTRPDGTYPKQGRTVRPGLRVIPMGQLRCMGGGIGGCSLSGKPQ
jgi:hypothetical protein